MKKELAFILVLLFIFFSTIFLWGLFSCLEGFIAVRIVSQSSAEEDGYCGGSSTYMEGGSLGSVKEDGSAAANCSCSGGGLSAEGGVPPKVPLFNVTNATNTRYLCNLVASVYDGRMWRFQDDAFSHVYRGEKIDYQVSKYSELVRDVIKITPLTNFSRFIPIAMYTVHIDSPVDLVFYPEYGIFYTEEEFDDEYTFTTVHYIFEESVLKEAKPIDEEKYLQLPADITQRTRELALKITADYDSAYDKAKAIEHFLRENYRYNVSYTRAPEGWEPVDWFLFEEKQGVCANFASAFVVLARSAGIPARIASGFVIEQKAEEQTVYANQAHAWPEVGFKDVGWIAFEPTPGYGEAEGTGGCCRKSSTPMEGSSQSSAEEGGEKGVFFLVETVTVITEVSKDSVKKGGSFIVKGKVMTKHSGELIDNMPVDIYLVKFDKEKGIVCGEVCGHGRTVNGVFVIECNVSRDLYVGEYAVLAHSLGVGKYAGSWSDESFLIATTTKILSISSSNVKKGEVFYVSGSVTTDDGVPMDGVPVVIYISKEKIHGGTIIGNGETINGFFNISCIVPLNIDVGEYHIIAHAKGEGWRLESWSDPEIKVYAATKIKISVPTRVKLDSEISICGYLMEEDGSPLANQSVSLYVDDVFAEQTFTKEDGSFCFYHVFSDKGRHVIKVKFFGTEYFEKSESSAEIEVEEVHLTILTKNIIVRGEDVIFQGRVLFGNEALSNATIEIVMDNEVMCSIRTDKDGQFKCIRYVPSDMKLGVSSILYRIIEFDYEETQQVTVVGRTVLIPEIKETFTVGENLTISGRLMEGDKPLSGKNIKIYVNGELVSSTLTNDYGVFSTILPLNEVGNYSIRGVFEGEDFYLGSSFERQVRILPLFLEVYTEKEATRGEEMLIHGRVLVGAKPEANVSVIVLFDGDIIAQEFTDSQGVFNTSYYVPRETTVGNHVILYRIPEFGFILKQEIWVKSRTFLKVDAPSTASLGDKVTVNVTLLNDEEKPIENASISLLGYENFTDALGKAMFTVIIPKDFQGNEYSLEASYKGSSLYSPSSALIAISVRSKENPLTVWAYIGVPVGLLVAIAFFFIRRLKGGINLKKISLKKRKTAEKTEPKRSREETLETVERQKERMKGETPSEKADVHKIKVSLTIEFPEIAESMPNVWGVGENIRISVIARDNNNNPMQEGKIRILIDDKDLSSYKIEEGKVSFTYVFKEKGEYKVKAILEETDLYEAASAERKIRIVDYREEIVSLYHSFLKYIKDRNIPIRADMTPREIQQIALERNVPSEPLKRITRCFEIAQYSLRSIRRKHYEAMLEAINLIKEEAGV